MDPEVPGSSPGGGTIHPLNGHARYAAHVAARRGWSFRALDGGDGYCFEVRDGARACVIASGSASPYALNSAAAMSLARDKGFAALAFAAAGAPHPPSALFFVTDRHAAFRAPGREPADARAAAQSFAYPVFCKPVSGSRGDFAERIDGADAFADYLERVARWHDAIMVQPFLSGTEYRVIVLGAQALCAYRKIAPSVTGDGASTLSELATRLRAAAKPSTATPAPLSQVSAQALDGRLFRADETPPDGLALRLLGPANRSLGGDAEPIVAPSPSQAALAERAVAALGLSFAGVDLIETGEGTLVLEANASPALATLEAQGRWDLIEAIWSANLEAALR